MVRVYVLVGVLVRVKVGVGVGVLQSWVMAMEALVTAAQAPRGGIRAWLVRTWQASVAGSQESFWKPMREKVRQAPPGSPKTSQRRFTPVPYWIMRHRGRASPVGFQLLSLTSPR